MHIFVRIVESGSFSKVATELSTQQSSISKQLSSLENIIGPQKDLETVCIGYDDDVDKRKEEVKELISKVDSGNGVILLTEMFGNTPSNLLISLINENKVEMIGGINLPLLVKLGSLRENSSIEEVIHASVEAGHKYIGIASEILSKEDS